MREDCKAGEAMSCNPSWRLLSRGLEKKNSSLASQASPGEFSPARRGEADEMGGLKILGEYNAETKLTLAELFEM